MIEADLEQQLEALHPKSFGWALACCRRDGDEAAEVLQVTYLKVIEGRARYDGRASLKTWLFAVIRQTAAERRRRAWVRRLLLGRRLGDGEPTAPPTGEQHVANRQRREAVLAALAALPARQREVLDLVFYHDLTIEEAARVMGVALGTARLHYARGKERLLARFAPEDTP